MMYFPGVEGMLGGWVLAGIIWSLALGFAAGNYACSLVHRLPRGRAILENKPYCGECRTPLATKDLFPVFSALLLKHRCRYCGAKIPVSHFWTEVLVGLLFVLCFLQFNFSQAYFMVALLGVFLIILACIDCNEGKILDTVVVPSLVVAMIYRTYLDFEIYGFLQGGFLALLLGLVIWRKDIRKVGHIYTLPDKAKLLVLAGVASGEYDFFIVIPLFFVLHGLLLVSAKLLKWERMPMTIALGFAIMTPLLFPQASLHAAMATLGITGEQGAATHSLFLSRENSIPQ